MTYFDKRLFDLLPPLYRIEDASGDLAAFLQVPAPTLDAFKDLIDRFPEIFDVDRCEDRFLPFLAALVGLPFDGTEDPRPQRRLIKEAVPTYRRKATIPAIRRSLTDTGWQGTLEETFRRALRLGSRSALNTSKLPGQIFSLGVYRVVCENQSVGLREALKFHHPAGTRNQTRQTRLFFARYFSTNCRFSRATRLRITRFSNSIRGFPRVNTPTSLSTREVKDFSVHD